MLRWCQRGLLRQQQPRRPAMPTADAKTVLLSLKVFLASPGDVADERALARDVVEHLRGGRL